MAAEIKINITRLSSKKVSTFTVSLTIVFNTSERFISRNIVVANNAVLSPCVFI